jgi:hypothetical protein
MKKILILLTMALLLVSCSANNDSSPFDYIDQVNSTDLTAEQGGIASLGVSEEELKKQRGEPRMRMEPDKSTVILEYEDYQYSVIDGKVAGYMIVKPGMPTARQVQVGDAEARIAEMYGKDFFERKQDDIALIGYVDKDDRKLMEFSIIQDKVAAIVVSDLSLFEPSEGAQ